MPLPIPKLSDNIRQFSYEWILNNIGTNTKKILDIGTRESKLSAYLSFLGFDVTSVERDRSFDKLQEEYKKEFKTEFSLFKGDLLEMLDNKFDTIISVYALQHNIEKDIECYEKCAKICNRNIFIVNEFNYTEGKLDLGRNDGDMRIYSLGDVYERIINPIKKIKDIYLLKMDYARFDYPKQEINFCSDQEANTIMLKIGF